MSKPVVARFRNGAVATEHDLNCIAKAFGFMSWLSMEETMRAADAKRARKAADLVRASAAA